MGWVYLDEIKDKEKRKKLEEKYDQHIKKVEDNRILTENRFRQNL